MIHHRRWAADVKEQMGYQMKKPQTAKNDHIAPCPNTEINNIAEGLKKV
jgi:hypothetical protein